ncbi:hypothetical protein ES703_98685 [subsurface metagenome]
MSDIKYDWLTVVTTSDIIAPIFSTVGTVDSISNSLNSLDSLNISFKFSTLNPSFNKTLIGVSSIPLAL